VSRFNHILSLVCQINIEAESILAAIADYIYVPILGGNTYD
jgi:hypothetical protein